MSEEYRQVDKVGTGNDVRWISYGSNWMHWKNPLPEVPKFYTVTAESPIIRSAHSFSTVAKTGEEAIAAFAKSVLTDGYRIVQLRAYSIEDMLDEKATELDCAVKLDILIESPKRMNERLQRQAASSI